MEQYLAAIAHFAHWTVRRVRSVAELDENLVNRFLNHLRTCQCAPRCERSKVDARAALVHLFDLLRNEALIAPRETRLPAAIVAELSDFDGYLADVRGLQVITRRLRSRHVSAFLLAHFTEAIDLAALSPDQIRAFSSSYCIFRRT